MRKRIALALVAPAVLACDSMVASESPALPGTYVLEAPVVTEHPGARSTLLADTLRFSTNGAATRSTRAEFDDGRTRTITVRSGAPYYFEMRAGILELTYICGPAELCAPAPHMVGRFTEDGLVFYNSDLRYRRAD
jgi:hypothetical protein